jgi:tryptophan-rich sensory protein
MRRLAVVFLEVLKRMNNARLKIALMLCFVLCLVAAVLSAFWGDYEETAVFLLFSYLYLVMLGIIRNLKQSH